MKKIKSSAAIIISVLVMLSLTIPAFATAAEECPDWLDNYKEYMLDKIEEQTDDDSEKFTKFGFAYIDDDDIPELLLASQTEISIVSCNKFNSYEPDEIDSIETENGFYYCEGEGLILSKSDEDVNNVRVIAYTDGSTNVIWNAKQLLKESTEEGGNGYAYYLIDGENDPGEIKANAFIDEFKKVVPSDECKKTDIKFDLTKENVDTYTFVEDTTPATTIDDYLFETFLTADPDYKPTTTVMETLPMPETTSAPVQPEPVKKFDRDKMFLIIAAACALAGTGMLLMAFSKHKK